MLRENGERKKGKKKKKRGRGRAGTFWSLDEMVGYKRGKKYKKKSVRVHVWRRKKRKKNAVRVWRIKKRGKKKEKKRKEMILQYFHNKF